MFAFKTNDQLVAMWEDFEMTSAFAFYEFCAELHARHLHGRIMFDCEKHSMWPMIMQYAPAAADRDYFPTAFYFLKMVVCASPTIGRDHYVEGVVAPNMVSLNESVAIRAKIKFGDSEPTDELRSSDLRDDFYEKQVQELTDSPEVLLKTMVKERVKMSSAACALRRKKLYLNPDQWLKVMRSADRGPLRSVDSKARVQLELMYYIYKNVHRITQVYTDETDWDETKVAIGNREILESMYEERNTMGPYWGALYSYISGTRPYKPEFSGNLIMEEVCIHVMIEAFSYAAVFREFGPELRERFRGVQLVKTMIVPKRSNFWSSYLTPVEKLTDGFKVLENELSFKSDSELINLAKELFTEYNSVFNEPNPKKDYKRYVVPYLLMKRYIHSSNRRLLICGAALKTSGGYFNEYMHAEETYVWPNFLAYWYERAICKHGEYGSYYAHTLPVLLAMAASYVNRNAKMPKDFRRDLARRLLRDKLDVDFVKKWSEVFNAIRTYRSADNYKFVEKNGKWVLDDDYYKGPIKQPTFEALLLYLGYRYGDGGFVSHPFDRLGDFYEVNNHPREIVFAKPVGGPGLLSLVMQTLGLAESTVEKAEPVQVHVPGLPHGVVPR